MTKHSKQEQWLIQKDEEIIKQLLHNLYERKLKGGGLSGGNVGDFFKSFAHGFLLPFKSDIARTVFNVVAPGSGELIHMASKGLDSVIPGKKYDSFGDITGKGRGKVGRPRKIRVEPNVTVVKKSRGRPKKVATPCECN